MNCKSEAKSQLEDHQRVVDLRQCVSKVLLVDLAMRCRSHRLGGIDELGLIHCDHTIGGISDQGVVVFCSLWYEIMGLRL